MGRCVPALHRGSALEIFHTATEPRGNYYAGRIRPLRMRGKCASRGFSLSAIGRRSGSRPLAVRYVFERLCSEDVSREICLRSSRLPTAFLRRTRTAAIGQKPMTSLHSTASQTMATTTSIRCGPMAVICGRSVLGPQRSPDEPPGARRGLPPGPIWRLSPRKRPTSRAISKVRRSQRPQVGAAIRTYESPPRMGHEPGN